MRLGPDPRKRHWGRNEWLEWLAGLGWVALVFSVLGWIAGQVWPR